MAFCIPVTSIRDSISGNELVLSVVGVRAYNHTNMYGKKNTETFKLAIGFINQVCTNLCISSKDGYSAEIKVSNIRDLQMQAIELFQNYNAKQHLEFMGKLSPMQMSETQFATFLGRTRLYQYLPKNEQRQLPVLAFGDTHLNMIAKDYYHDKRFCKDENGYLNLWNLYNLFTNANRSSSYIDTFLDRAANGMDFIEGIFLGMCGNPNYQWFLK